MVSVSWSRVATLKSIHKYLLPLIALTDEPVKYVKFAKNSDHIQTPPRYSYKMAALKDMKIVQPQNLLECLENFRQCNLCTKKIPWPPPPPNGECKVLCVFKVIRITGSPQLLYTTRPKNMYESRATDLHVTTGVPFALLTRYVKSLCMGNKQNSCTNNYSTFMN
jgi:hypothetical protein